MYGASPYGTIPYGSAPITEAPVAHVWPLRLEVGPYTVRPTFPLRLEVRGTVTPSFPLILAVVDVASITGAAFYAWSLRVVIGDVDWSDRVVNAATVKNPAGAASTAQFSVRPDSGPVDLDEWTGTEVTLDYIWRAETGPASYTLRMFTGTVDAIEIDDATRVFTFSCVDRRTGLLKGATRDAIAAMLPGTLWSPAWFDADADGARYAEDCLSTLDADFDLDPDGAPRLTPWAAKATPDWSVTRIVAGSLKLNLARTTDLVHQVRVNMTYRFSRLRRREARIHYLFDLADLFDHSVAPPSSSLIEEAVRGAGWEVSADPVYTRPAEWYEHEDAWIGVDDQNGALEAMARIGLRFAQSVDERYAITVSVADAGLDPRLTKAISGALECHFDAAAWEEDSTLSPILAEPGLSVETAADATSDAETGRAGSDLALRAGLAMGRREVLGSHRQTTITFDVPMHPFMRRDHTVSIATGGVSARGKGASVTHTLDRKSGRAMTTVEIAISRPSLPVPEASTPMSAPAYPAIPAPSAAVVDAHYIELGNHVGGYTGAPAYDATWAGWIINEPSESRVDGLITRWNSSSIYGNGSGGIYPAFIASDPPSRFDGVTVNPGYDADSAYDTQFRVIAPAVESAARDNLTLDIAADYLVVVPEDPFTYTV